MHKPLTKAATNQARIETSKESSIMFPEIGTRETLGTVRAGGQAKCPGTRLRESIERANRVKANRAFQPLDFHRVCLSHKSGDANVINTRFVIIQRDFHPKRLIRHMWNGDIKVFTGIRGCSKSVLLLELFYDYLLSKGPRHRTEGAGLHSFRGYPKLSSDKNSFCFLGSYPHP